MSWYADIHGEIVTSHRARPLVMARIGKWTKPKAEGKVDVYLSGQRLVVRFNGYYRNLAQYVVTEVWRIARRFPYATRGAFRITSTDGCFFAAVYRVAEGRVYRRALAIREKEWRPTPSDRNGRRPRGA